MARENKTLNRKWERGKKRKERERERLAYLLQQSEGKERKDVSPIQLEGKREIKSPVLHRTLPTAGWRTRPGV